MDDARADRGLLATLVGDGRPLLSLTGILLLLSGLFAIFLLLASPHAHRSSRPWLRSAHGAPPALRIGRWLLVATAAGLIAAGATILTIGMTQVFVATDLVFIGLDRQAIASVSPRLIPLIAHDRAGFGGGLVSTGLLIGLCAWYA